MRFLQLVRLALQHRVISALILVIVSAAGWQLFVRTPTSFIPTEDQGLVRMAVQLPEGAAFPRTEAVSEAFSRRFTRSTPSARSSP